MDDKVLTDWNGMAIAAFAEAGRLFGEDRYTTAAVRAADFVLGLRDDQGRLLHVWSQGRAKQSAFLDDYAFLIHGLLNLYRATETARWLAEAERLTVEMERQLREPSGRYFTSPADPALLVRSSSASGGAIPAGNGVAIVNLLELARVTGRPIYRARALSAIQSFSAELESLPVAMPTVARAVLMVSGAAAGTRDSIPVADVGLPSAETLVAAELRLVPAPMEEGWRRFELSLMIRDGWHINANPASLELLIPTRIEGDLRAVEYPQGTSLRPAFADEELRVYSGRVEIGGEISMPDPEAPTDVSGLRRSPMPAAGDSRSLAGKGKGRRLSRESGIRPQGRPGFGVSRYRIGARSPQWSCFWQNPAGCSIHVQGYSSHRPFRRRAQVTMTMVIIGVLVMGWLSLDRLPLEFLPSFSSSNITVIAPYPSSSPEEVERLVVRPLEDSLGTINRIDTMSATASADRAQVRITFLDGTDMEMAAVDVRDRVDRVRHLLPDDLDRIWIRRFQTSDIPVIRFDLSAPWSQVELYDFAENILLRRLERLDGVAQVDIGGLRLPELQVHLDSGRMRAHGIDARQLTTLLRDSNLNVSAGDVKEGSRKLLVRSVGEFGTRRRSDSCP